MGMYIMNGKTFLERYINEDPKKVLETQYVIVSSLIRKSGRYEEQVITGNQILYPSEELIMDFDDFKDPEYCERYKEMIDRDAKPFLASLIQYVIDEESTVVFLCSKKEWRRNYLQLIAEYVWEEFSFHIHDYKKLKEGREKVRKTNEGYTLSICRKVLRKAQKEKKRSMLSSERGREKYFNDLDKSEIKKLLKKRNLYIKGMSKSEMIDTLNVFM